MKLAPGQWGKTTGTGMGDDKSKSQKIKKGEEAQ
jgi:hypothetical protein